jgi:hypothetical protein
MVQELKADRQDIPAIAAGACSPAVKEGEATREEQLRINCINRTIAQPGMWECG